jgi:hypothetical protein
MVDIISCPSCARRLSVNQALAGEKLLFKCPACQTVFELSAAELAARPQTVDQAPQPLRSDGGLTHGGFSETPFRPPAPAGEDAAENESSKPIWTDDANQDWPDFDRPGRKTKRRRRLGLAGVALLVLAAAAILYFVGTGSEPALVGSWRGTFEFGMEKIDCTYRFGADGSFVDEHIDPGTGFPMRFPGRYEYAHGRVTIRWVNNGFETASVRRTGPNTIEYVVLGHNQPEQIGCKVIFSRLPR